MKHFLLAVVTSFLLACNVYAQQDKYIRHKVSKSETITQIAQKYRVSPFDIYKLNPDAQQGIRENDIIIIPSVRTTSDRTSTKTVASGTTHVVQPKETLFSIARTHSVTVDDLRNANTAALADGLKSGQTIVIPGKTATITQRTVVAENVKPATAPVYHIVEAGQTKFSIAKKYGISVAELERQNPAITGGLPTGYKLEIKNGAVATSVFTQRPQPKTYTIGDAPAQTTEKVYTAKRTSFANYEVKPQETLYSLTQMFDISQAELLALNPSLKDGVKIGMILKVPSKGSLIREKTGYKDLTQTLSNSRKKEMVLLLPFNASKIQSDSSSSMSSRLKNDAFLNMTLDFYSGALMAIDSARSLGMNINVRIMDSEENRSSSNVANLIKANNFKNVDAVIGPFYQQHSETAAQLLLKDSIPVISPLSKETGTPYANLYQSMAPSDATRKAIMNYMVSKNGNIIVIADPKKQANREFITANYPQARFVQLGDNGGLVADNLRSLLVKDRINYVILDSEKTGMILSATNLLLNEMANYKIQLAIIEKNETLDFEEISMKRLTILKMLYPSLTRENTSAAAQIFDKNYKEKNKVFPSAYATRGFDVTFDTMLRLSQEKSFSATINEDKTEQIESKFNYVLSPNGEYVNNGVYILHYDEDLTVKEAQ